MMYWSGHGLREICRNGHWEGGGPIGGLAVHLRTELLLKEPTILTSEDVSLED